MKETYVNNFIRGGSFPDFGRIILTEQHGPAAETDHTYKQRPTRTNVQIGHDVFTAEGHALMQRGYLPFFCGQGVALSRSF